MRIRVATVLQKSVALVFFASLCLYIFPRHVANALELTSRSVKLANSTASATTIHRIGFSINENVLLGSIVFEYCSNSPIVGDVCDPPTGLDLTGATLSEQINNTAFVIDSGSTANKIIISRPLAPPSLGPTEFVLSDVVNPSIATSHYVRIQTYNSSDASGPSIESGGTVFAIVPGLVVSAEVPPYLTFCGGVSMTNFDCNSIDSFYINLGEFSSTQTSTAESTFVVATNAQYGYNVSINGTTLTSNNNTIPALVTPTASQTGTSQFGINLRDNTTPDIGANVFGPGVGVPKPNYDTPDLYRFVSGDTIAASTGSTDFHRFTVSYIANISSSQPAGYYATTLSFICLANF